MFLWVVKLCNQETLIRCLMILGGSFCYDRSHGGGFGFACTISVLLPKVTAGIIDAIAIAINTTATILFIVFNLKSPLSIFYSFLYYKFLGRTYKPLNDFRCCNIL